MNKSAIAAVLLVLLVSACGKKDEAVPVVPAAAVPSAPLASTPADSAKPADVVVPAASDKPAEPAVAPASAPVADKK